MSQYLSLTLETIDPTKPQELFIGSQADGICYAIVQVSIIEDGKFIRACKINKLILDHLSSIQIPMPKTKEK